MNVREIALDVLVDIEKNKAYSNLTLNHAIEKESLHKKDIGLLTEIVYGTLQRRDALDFMLSRFVKRDIEQWVRMLLRLSAYQLAYLDRVPEHAVLFEAVEIAKKRGHQGIASMVNGVLRAMQRQGTPSFEDIYDDLERLSIETSHPRWLIDEWMERFGYEDTKAMCEINVTAPVQTARVNVLRISVEEAIERLQSEGVEASISEAREGIRIARGNIIRTESFKEGLLTIQDESSMLVAYALGAEEHDRILDSCAAPGGKATHIAELLRNTGEVVALDIHDHKIKLIENHIKRLRLKNVHAQKLDARFANEQYVGESFDKILIDAPCSGLGVLRRKPEAKYTKTKNDIASLAALQLKILQALAPLLKKGGTLVYSTCTVMKEENEQVIHNFLEKNKDFSQDHTLVDRMPEGVRKYVQDGQLQLLPHYFGTDGFFICSLKRGN